MLATNSYEWVLEADIKACFDEISHVAVQDRLRARVADKRVMAIIKAFLKAGILTELGGQEETLPGTPPCGVLTAPTIANFEFERSISRPRERSVVRRGIETADGRPPAYAASMRFG